MKLKDFQKEFTRYLYTKNPQPSEVEASLDHSCPVGVENGLRIYRDNLVHGLVSYMTSVFPLCYKALGDKNFKFFVRELLYEQPSDHADIRAYGGKFREFLRKRKELQQTEWAEGLAGYEWICHEILYKEETDFLKADDLKAYENFSLDELVVEVIPSLFLYHSPWPIISMIEILEGRSDPNKFSPKESFISLRIKNRKIVSEEIDSDLWHVLRDFKYRKTLKQVSQMPYAGSSVEKTWSLLMHCAREGLVESIHTQPKFRVV